MTLITPTLTLMSFCFWVSMKWGVWVLGILVPCPLIWAPLSQVLLGTLGLVIGFLGLKVPLIWPVIIDSHVLFKLSRFSSIFYSWFHIIIGRRMIDMISVWKLLRQCYYPACPPLVRLCCAVGMRAHAGGKWTLCVCFLSWAELGSRLCSPLSSGRLCRQCWTGCSLCCSICLSLPPNPRSCSVTAQMASISLRPVLTAHDGFLEQVLTITKGFLLVGSTHDQKGPDSIRANRYGYTRTHAETHRHTHSHVHMHPDTQGCATCSCSPERNI